MSDDIDRKSRAPRTSSGSRGLVQGRALWLATHRYIGFVAGAVFVVIGLSGSLLAFRVEIDEFLNKDLFVPTHYTLGGERASVDRIIETSRSAAPEDAAPVWMHFPKSDGGYFDVIYSTRESEGRAKAYQIVVDPVTAAVKGARLIVDDGNHFAEPLAVLLIHLHSALLLGENGATLVGFVGLFLLLSLTTGVYLWWPRNGRWRQAFQIKRGASAERLTLDLHKTTGVYVVAIFAVMIFSGLYLTFGAQVTALVDLFSPVHTHRLQKQTSASADGRPSIGAEAAVAAVDRLFPDGRLMSLSLPEAPESVFVVGKRADDEVNVSEPRRQAAVDRYSGQILAIEDPHRFTAGEKFLEWQFPLHSGEAFGDLGRAAVALLGVAPALLYITGLARWLQKRRARARDNV
ncbi:PepSY-associated TM helix domain-containing protein [Methylosinus sp. LW4]|uniref:PepSY-associated TM helix domain-containing protein n=1 Tax=Methylosinus sp. LW4 TaxID=136993 RepID=UPI00037CD70B|nr:PepSY-associated TM helix domain-containing protein [Methylosinus sp. LW4]